MAGYTVGAGTTKSAGYTITAADGNAFALTNDGVIGAAGAAYGVVVQTTGDFVVNSGKILADTAGGKGVFSSSSVRVTNNTGGTIKAGYGINLYGGGSISNASGALVTGLDPIRGFNNAVYVGNSGTITGTGTSSTQGGVVLNAGGYVYNKPNATISGANGVLEGVFAKVRNAGTIVGNNADGVDLTAGGTVTSETQTPNSAATISGSYGGIVISGGSGYVLNGSGQISGGVAGVFLLGGGYLHQIGGSGGGAGGGTITADYAVAINNGPGTVDTGGVIIGTQLGVGMDGAGPHKVTLASSGATISGAKAISIAGGNGYIYTRGTINGGANGTAITMATGYNNLLEIYSGAKITGIVDGGNFQDAPHTTTLLLAAGGPQGTLTGFGSRYYGIGRVTIKSGASWTMDSTSEFIDPSFASGGSTTFLPVALVDDGTLIFGGSDFGRLTLGSNAHLTVTKGGVITPAYASQAIYAPSLTTAPVVVTDGQITAARNQGIRLDDGGTVTNQVDGVISGYDSGVLIQNAKGTVTNSGQITSAIAYGIALGGGGTVTNSGGTIMGTLGVGIYGGSGMVTNTGRISGSGSNDGVELTDGGTVFNQAGTIIGLGGIFITGGAGTVTNYGQITGTGIYSVNLSPGFANRLRIKPGASFSGNFVDGGNTAGATAASTIELLSAASAGTLAGLGSAYRYFSNITIDSGATWTIASGSIANYQTLVDSGTLINDVAVASGITLANGTFINASGYIFNVAVGVLGLSGTNVVVNNNNIEATQIGVSLATAGRVTNQSDGFIGGRIGVYIAQGPASSIVNQGLIEGYIGAYLLAGGSVDNQTGGLISGRLGVVIIGGNGTVRNAGIIASVGDYGVTLPDHGTDRLVLVPGSTIAGLVHGGLAGTGTSFSSLELASGSSAGTIAGIGSKYLNFRAITVDPDAAWTFAPGQTIAANQALYDDGTLTNSATVLTVIQLGAGAVLTNAIGGTVSGGIPVLAPSHLAGPATVVNYGLIDGGSNGYGVDFLSFGSVTNRAGTIKGHEAVVFAGGGTLTNTGSIVGSSGIAVSFELGFQNRLAMSPGAVFSGTVDGGNKSASGTAISTLELMAGTSAGTLSGIGSQYVDFQNFQVDSGAAWTLAAGQTIQATYTFTDDGTLTNNATILTGLTLGAGASVTNAASATISSASDGAVALGSAATVVNSGTLHGGSMGVSLIGASAAVINRSGMISGGGDGVTISSGVGTVTNYGQVLGGALGVILSAGGTVTNRSGAISGILFAGVDIAGGAGTVANYATIASGGDAVFLAAGLQNRVIAGPGAVFEGTVNAGGSGVLELASGSSAGTIVGIGSHYTGFSQVVIDQGAAWTLAGGTIGAGTVLTDRGTLTNDATVLIQIMAPGLLTNASGGTISANRAVLASGVTTVVNSGLINGAANSYGIELLDGGSVTNLAGTITGSKGIVVFNDAGTIRNSGTIAGSSGTAVALSSNYQNLVAIGPGAVFTGTVNGGNAIGNGFVSTLELMSAASAGTIGGIGSKYINFTDFIIDGGASWRLAAGQTLVAGTTLTNAGALTIADGALQDAGSVINDGLIQENAGTLTVATLSGNGEVLIGAGSTLTASGSVAAGQIVDFAGAGLLALVPAQFSGQIDGLGDGGRIELTGITDATTASVVNGNTLAILQSAGPTLDLMLDPARNYAGVLFPIVTLNGNQFVEVASPTGPTVIDQGETESVTGAAGSTMAAITGASGGITVTGAKSLLITTTGPFIVGDGGVGGLSIESDGTVITSPGTTAVGATIANQSGASGSSVNVSGAGSEWQVTGSLVVGDAGFGSLSLSQGGSASAGALTLGATAGSDGVVSVAGTGTALTLTGDATIGNAAAGELSILAGASVSAAGLTIGTANAASSGNVDVEGAGSTLFIDTGGFLNIGVAGGGSGVLTIGAGTTLHFAGTVVENGHASYNNNGGVIDPDAIEFTTPDNSGNGLNEYSLYVGNINAVQISAGEGVWDTPMVLTGTSVADAQNNIDNNSDVGEWQLGQGGTMVLNTNTIDVGQAIVFEDATDTLVIGQLVNGGSAGVSGVDPTVAPGAENVFQAGGFEAQIWGYQVGDRILFDNMFVASDTIVGGNTLEVFISGDATPEFLTFFNKTGNRALGVAGMEAAAAEIAADNAPCFAAGTRISTERGEVEVEGIGVGERVRVLLGGGDGLVGNRWAEVIWVGRREVDCSGHKQPKKVWPVRVAAGAFGPGCPHADVWLSPDHAVYVGDVLIPVKYLVNGTTIAQVPRERVVYHHLELAQHNVLLAEGLPAESFLDMKDGSNYSNRPGPVRLYPDFTVRMWEAFGCATLVVTGPELAAARALVARFAQTQAAA